MSAEEMYGILYMLSPFGNNKSYPVIRMSYTQLNILIIFLKEVEN